MKKYKLHTVITILVVVLLSTTISFGQEVSPMGVVNVWKFVKQTEDPAINYSLAAPISAWITGPGSISSSTSKTFTVSFSPVNITAELKSAIKASVNLTVSNSTTSTIGYTLTESGARKVRMWYAPEIVTVKGTAQLWATPGGLVQSFAVTSKYPRPAQSYGHYYLSTN